MQSRSMSLEEYFSKPAERLVLEGYRYWSNGYALGSIAPWEAAKDLFQSTLGVDNGRRALSSLSNFISVLGACATCPLKTYPYGSQHLCKDEVLILGLISGIQYDDPSTIFLCLKHLSCSTQCDDVANAAGEFALLLKTMNKILSPVGAGTIRSILVGGNSIGFSDATIH